MDDGDPEAVAASEVLAAFALVSASSEPEWALFLLDSAPVLLSKSAAALVVELFGFEASAEPLAPFLGDNNFSRVFDPNNSES